MNKKKINNKNNNENENENENEKKTFESVDKKYSSFEVVNSIIQSSPKKYNNGMEKEIPEISISISSESSSSSNNSISFYFIINISRN